VEAEETDVVVVGARCAGSAAATAFARGGRRVVALDRARFPSDTLSTHLLFSGGLLELQALGALARVEAVGAPRLPVALMHADGMTVTAGYHRQAGIEHGMCARRRPRARQVRLGRDERAGQRSRQVLLVGRAEGVRVDEVPPRRVLPLARAPCLGAPCARRP